MVINCGGRLLDLQQPQIMGILNVTPDSFYDGGELDSQEKLLAQAAQMLDDGASILDIGGVSTRPGAKTVPLDEELERVIPAVEQLRRQFPEALLSVDTYRAEVAKQAVEAGARLINDVSGGRLDDQLIDTVAALNVPYILMHMQGTPQTMQDAPNYGNILTDLLDYFINRVGFLRQAGIKDVIIDVGFGFGKTIAHNYTLLKHLGDFRSLDLPMLVGISRKSMIWKLLENSPSEALNGTTALHMVALQQGANILRVHDVRAAAETIKLWETLESLD